MSGCKRYPNLPFTQLPNTPYRVYRYCTGTDHYLPTDFFLPLASNHQCSRYVADFLPSSFHSYPFRMGDFICNGLLSRFSDCCLLLVQSLLPLATPLVIEFCSACRSAKGHEHNNETSVGLYISINGIS